MSSQDGSEPSSYDSEHYGDVARAGFTRMYVLTYSSLSPLDQYRDYRSERLHDEADDEERKMDEKPGDGDRQRRYDTLEAAFEDDDGEVSGVERFQLLYASGRHYFHGVIPMPDELFGADGSDDSDSNDDDEGKTDHSRQRRVPRAPLEDRISIADLPLLLPHFQSHQDGLTTIEQVTDFRQELRDVIYQMEEVGEFMVEELSKEKLVARIEDGAKEFHWMVSPENPTFFELQTYRRANESLADAGVVLVVMKIVVRGVLLDVIFHKDSYFATLRDNSDELALEDTFVPNVEGD
ncbi:hypothetical protein P43SY_004651 [Pythium insidiosum]|uniref:Uncharacterized protein n=1 Tax=Pythium insidiosum TaxID=114742 RepID=A0AAD5LUY1_PYTIN|nr:hypothetical protein P43SY_004651 [Pythium insidiosum]